MPTRLLREAILDSERVCSLTFPAEVFYRRLMSVVDDFGRFDGRFSVLRSRLYPLQVEKVREADIERWIAECEKAGLIVLYADAGKQYLLFKNLGEPRAKESKYPPPPAKSEYRAQTKTDANKREQTKASVPYSDSDSGKDKDQSAAHFAGSSPAESGFHPEPEVVDKTTEPPKAKRQRKQATGPHPESMRLFAELWEAKYGAKYPANFAKDGTMVSWMLDQVGGDAEKLKPVFRRFFADDDLYYAASARHELAKLRQHFGRWLVDAPLPQPKPNGFKSKGEAQDEYAARMLKGIIERGEQSEINFSGLPAARDHRPAIGGTTAPE